MARSQYEQVTSKQTPHGNKSAGQGRAGYAQTTTSNKSTGTKGGAVKGRDYSGTGHASKLKTGTKS